MPAHINSRAYRAALTAFTLFVTASTACVSDFDRFKRATDAGHSTPSTNGSKDGAVSSPSSTGDAATRDHANDAGGNRAPAPLDGGAAVRDANTSPDATGDAMCKASRTGCGCDPGYAAARGGCEDIDECATNNGGCAAFVTCVNTPGSFQCGDCMPGYIGGGSQGCTPVLSMLGITPGSLTPAFDSATTHYDVFVPLISPTLTLTPTAPTGASLTINGAPAVSGLPWQSAVSLGSSSIEIAVIANGGLKTTYSLAITHGKQEAYIKASNAEAQDVFGLSVAISGDTLLVGAPYEDSASTGVNGNQNDNSATDVGAAYVFVRVQDTWVQQAYLKSKFGSEPYRAQHFGSSVALAGEIAVVGAPAESGFAHGVNQSPTFPSTSQDPRVDGAAFVFERSNGTQWNLTAYLKPCNKGAPGSTVAIGDNTIVIGMPGEDNSLQGVTNASTCSESDGNAASSGAVYVFVRTASGWTQQAYLKASDSVSGLGFGGAMAIAGNSLAVGAGGANGSKGAIYIFARSNGMWSQQAKLTVDSAVVGQNLDVAIDGNTVVETARPPVVGANGNGEAYVFVGTGSTWTEQASLDVTLPGLFASHTTALSQDALLLGVSGDSSGGTGIRDAAPTTSMSATGGAYLFARSQGVWSRQALIKASNPDTNDTFGCSVGISGDTLAVGALGESSGAKGTNGGAAAEADNGSAQAGAVYVFR
jgi:hypothetical protein